MTRRTATTLARVAAGVWRMTASRELATKPGVSSAVRRRIFQIAADSRSLLLEEADAGRFVREAQRGPGRVMA